jgi:hypothetical protein
MDSVLVEADEGLGRKTEPLADMWNLIARRVRFEQVGPRTWWCVTIGSSETELGTAHLEEDRSLTCGWTERGTALLGDREPAFRRCLVGVLGDLLEEVRRGDVP